MCGTVHVRVPVFVFSSVSHEEAFSNFGSTGTLNSSVPSNSKVESLMPNFHDNDQKNIKGRKRAVIVLLFDSRCVSVRGRISKFQGWNQEVR